MSEFTFDSRCVSDLYKDVYGSRPRGAFWADWTGADDAGRQRIWDGLCVALDREMEEQRGREARALVAWRERMASIAGMNRVSVATAIRWDMDCHGVGSDIGFYCFEWGLPYSTEQEIQVLLAEERIAA